jgi:hypothetical protein
MTLKWTAPFAGRVLVFAGSVVSIANAQLSLVPATAVQFPSGAESKRQGPVLR